MHRAVSSDDSHIYSSKVRVENDNTGAPILSSVGHDPNDKHTTVISTEIAKDPALS